MNFLKQLFASSEERNIVGDQERSTQIPEQLFVADDILGQENDERPTPEVSVLNELMSRDYESLGFNEGYQLRSIDHLENKKMSIVAEFREALRKELEHLDREALELKRYMDDRVKELMPEQYNRLQHQLDAMQLEKSKLEAELDLAKSNEGYCERALCDYRIGFEKGFALYLDERHFSEKYRK